MPVVEQWEYATLTSVSNRETFWIGYSAPGAVDDEDYPNGAYAPVVGDLGGKGWELAAVTETVSSLPPPDYYARETRMYFKRPHDPGRGLRG